MKHVLLILFFVVAAFALQAQQAKPDLSVYPNPATEYISVQDDNDLVSQVVIYNLVGKKMKAFEFIKGQQYYVADLLKGMYLVQILDRNNKILTTQKVNKR